MDTVKVEVKVAKKEILDFLLIRLHAKSDEIAIQELKGWNKPERPSEDWSYVGPLLERHDLMIGPSLEIDRGYTATSDDGEMSITMKGSTFLEAGVRCLIATLAGREVSVPEDIMNRIVFG